MQLFTRSQDFRWRKVGRWFGWLVVLMMSLPTRASAENLQAGGEFVNRVYEDEAGTHRYVVFVPRNYSDDKEWPVIVWLHGASARGRDGRAPLVSGLAPNVHLRRETFPFLVVFPQCENLDSRLLGGWTDEREDADRALKILTDAERSYRIDPKRRTLAGVSMGAFGVWAVAARTPDLWSALIPVSGGGPLTLAKTLRDIPVWAFHAADDQVVPPVASSSLVETINAAGGSAHYTQLPGGGHNIGSRVFAKDEVYDWLAEPTQPPQQPKDWPLNSEAVAQLQDEVRFVPGAEMDRAVNIQITTEILTAIAHSLPGQVPPEAVQGGRGPQSQQTRSGWSTFQVHVSGVQYAGKVRLARLEPLADNQLRLRIGLQPLTMTVTSTEIQGRLLRAQAGAMQVVIGAQRPAWLNVVIRPHVESRKLRLELVSAEFPIENDNWYVTEPNGVDVFPLPMLRGRISRQLTDGVYAKRGEFEQQVVAGVPKLLQQIEERAQTQLERVVTFGRWPMPVWQPRAKFWLSDLTVDGDGLTISLGTTLAALARKSDDVPLVRHAGPAAVPHRAGEGVQISVASDVVGVWTQLLAASDVRRFHVRDFHAKDFHRLADRQFLSRVMPGLIDADARTELRSVLSFEQPMYVEPLDTPGETASRGASNFRLGGRELRLTISERAADDAAWIPLAEFPLSWSQDFQIATQKVGHRRRRMQLESVSAPEVVSAGKVLSPDGNPRQMLNHELVAAQFRRGWEATFATALAKQIQLPERTLAEVPFVCEGLRVEDQYLVVRLTKPTTQIRNASRDPLTYEIRSPESNWSQPLVLPPGMTHEYRAAGPLTWRGRVADRDQHYTLPVGSVSQYRSGEEHPLILVPDAPAPEAAPGIAGWADLFLR